MHSGVPEMFQVILRSGLVDVRVKYLSGGLQNTWRVVLGSG